MKTRAIIAMSLLILFAVTGLSLAKKVSQKIAVLEFSITGKPEGFEFLSKGIPQQIEIALDREGKLLVIRKYLWSKIYDPKKPISTIKDVVNFGLKANIDGVITGNLNFSKNRITMNIDVVEIAKGEKVYSKELGLSGNESIFNSINRFVDELSTEVIKKFPKKEAEIIIKEKKRIKKIFTDIKRIKHRISLGANYIFNTGRMQRIPLQNIDFTNVENLNEDAMEFDYTLNGVGVQLFYKYRSFEIGFDFNFSTGSGIQSFYQLGTQINFDFFRNIFMVSLRGNFFRVNYTDVGFLLKNNLNGHLNFYGAQLGFFLKPTGNFQFGMVIGASFGLSSFFNGIKHEFDKPGIGVDVNFEYLFNINDKWSLYLTFRMVQMGESEKYYQYGAGNQKEYRQKMGSGIITLGLKYNINWGKGYKPRGYEPKKEQNK